MTRRPEPAGHVTVFLRTGCKFCFVVFSVRYAVCVSLFVPLSPDNYPLSLFVSYRGLYRIAQNTAGVEQAGKNTTILMLSASVLLAPGG